MNGRCQPPRKSTTISAVPAIIAVYSPRKKRANFIERVFGVIAGDEFGLGLGKIERQAVRLREHRDREDDERDEHGNPEQDFAARLSRPSVNGSSSQPLCDLVIDDLRRGSVEPAMSSTGTALRPMRELVADHLRGAADAAEERILRIRRPAGEHDAVNADAGDREDEEQADVHIGDDHLARRRARCRTGSTASVTIAGIIARHGREPEVELVHVRRGRSPP